MLPHLVVDNPVICMQNVGSGNGVDMGRMLKQMFDMGQNAMQNTCTLQVNRQRLGEWLFLVLQYKRVANWLLCFWLLC